MSLGNLLEILLPVSIFTYCFFSTRLLDDCLPGYCVKSFSLWEKYPFLKTAIEIAVMFTGYELIRVLVAMLYDSSTIPFDNAAMVISFEKNYLKFMNEHTLQTWALQYEWLIFSFNHFYKLSHWTSCAIFVAYFFIYKRSHFHLVKYWFIVANLVAFSLFVFFPLAPPRLVAELSILDTIRLLESYAPSGSLVNQFAAMPSMHFGYSLLFTIAYLHYGNLNSESIPREKLYHILRSLPIIFYPIFMLLCIVVTGNHFFLDAMVASLVVILSLFIVLPFRSWSIDSSKSFLPSSHVLEM